jgi:cell division protein FtsA
MVNGLSREIFTAIDVGTTKICVLVARLIDQEHIEIIGIGKAPSDGLAKGVVVDIAKTIRAIKLAVEDASLMAGVPIESAYIGISGGHIHALNSHGVVPIKKGEIKPWDVDAVLAAARAVAIPEDQQILHVLPQYFVIDSRDQVHDPIGMHGIRLEVQTHIITGSIASVQNLIKCCERAGVMVKDIVLEQLASASAVLTPDEKQLGVAVLDIGGGTSDLAIYQHGSIRHTFVLPVAGNHFTHDLAVGLRTSLANAEEIKKMYGCADQIECEFDACIEVDLIHGNQKQIVRMQDILNILRPRAFELLTLVHNDITSRKLEHLMNTGLVLTGGGSLLKGMKELAERIYKLPVRIGIPQQAYGLPQSLLTPQFATGYGLLAYSIRRMQSSKDRVGGPLMKRVFDRMKSWVSEIF